MTKPAYTLSDDGKTLVIRQQVPGGVRTATYHRDPQAGPFTDADVALALGLTPGAGRQMQPGQRSRTRRAETRFGTVWTHLMLGPPTWWLPKLRRERDGTVMAGWFRLAVAVKFGDAAVIYQKHLAIADHREPARKPGRIGKRSPICTRCGHRGHLKEACPL